jgi:hypothetical protein
VPDIDKKRQIRKMYKTDSYLRVVWMRYDVELSEQADKTPGSQP